MATSSMDGLHSSPMHPKGCETPEQGIDDTHQGWLNNFMEKINRETLFAYLDDALSDAETAQLEQALRQSDVLRQSLQAVMQERDRGEHSLGAIWRRERLTCPAREKLGSFLLQVLEDAEQDYISFHINQIGCPFCQANLADLQAQQKEMPPLARERRRRIVETSAGFLNNLGNPPR